jgi:hypothetical protein
MTDYYPQQTYGWPAAPQQPPAGAMGLLQLHVQGSMMTTSLIHPSVSIDGYPTQIKYGDNPFQLLAGRHHIEVYMQYMRKYGQAALDFNIYPNAQVDVWYAGPKHQFASGDIGFEPQKAKGMGLMIGMIAVLVFLFVLLIIVRFNL